MSRTVTKQVFQFDELSDSAKEKARDWFREGLMQDNDWYDSTYEDAERIGNLFGIEFKQKEIRTMGGSIRYEPTIWFSGFASQGDGACFEGRYAYAKGGAAKVREYAPTDEKLHMIADTLQAVQKRAAYRITASVEHSGHYYHPGCTNIEVEGAKNAEDEELIRSALRTFMDWIYRQLEAESEYLESDESVDENIRANEYEFEADGSRTRD